MSNNTKLWNVYKIYINLKETVSVPKMFYMNLTVTEISKTNKQNLILNTQ